MKPVRAEKYGWRDERISARHREYGYDCPAADIDWLLIEYHTAKTAALVEYKHHNAGAPNLMSATMRAMRDLADRAGVPLWVALYWPDTWAYRVYAANDAAYELLGDLVLDMTERDYVELLYRVRRAVVSRALDGVLMDERPPVEVAA